MKIAIIGAGAMGSLYGGYLSRAGEDVYLVDIWQSHIDEINSNGLIIKEGEEEIVVYPKAFSKAEEIGSVDLAIIFVKSILTEKALANNKAILGSNTLVMSLQNGYGNIEQIEKYVKSENIIAGTTAHGATMLGPGNIKHAGNGVTHIGWLKNNKNNSIEQIAAALKRAGFDTNISDNVMELIWSKLIVNVGINALTAILEVENGKLLDIDETKYLMKLAVEEAIDVAEALGVKFNRDETIEKVMQVAYNTAENKSSMLQDILNKRKTEIETINGAIVREGIKHFVKTPVNTVLLNLIKAKEVT
ncbi:ketopantoate reductase family protein [Clostridium aciditolerans]|uniref:2-dehydropantoate 2-reductase n=1 Tax=Clostridium aciditolerans TaxID=339861 RepID=A0A934M7B2_9CLOT|nr:2-dehydropantoate 2-reductase [Clostridium aciditolerans]MBI6875503.1 2-dehydropantoate 2-reductase [Clostridium aciditolerans]